MQYNPQNKRQPQKQNPEPPQKIDINLDISRHTFQAHSINIFSPFPLYQPQKQYISYIIECLNSNKNALVQSPTGTGKTMSLLCSTLSWVRHQQQLGHTPTRIVYTSRTHAQLKQVVQELKKTGFLVKLSILGSRDQTCINKDLTELNRQGKQLECLLRVMKKNGMFCKYFKHEEYYGKMKTMGEIADLQEIKHSAKQHQFCPFYYEKYSKNKANLILMPYSYLFGESEAKLQEIAPLIQNSILIFDQAHNIPNVCESSKQFSISLVIFSRALYHLADFRQKFLQPQKQKNKKKGEPEQVQIMKSTLQQIQTHAAFVTLLHSHFQTLILDVSQNGLIMSASDFMTCLDTGTKSSQFGKISSNLKKLTSSIPSIQSDIMLYPYWALQSWFTFLYKITEISQTLQTQNSNPHSRIQIMYSGSDIKINIFCLDPRPGFQQILKLKPKAIILTSGTLSPLNSVSMQLGAQFNKPLACPHIMTNEQVNGCILRKGPNGVPMNFNFQNRDNKALYKDLGLVLVEIIDKTPNGVVVFVPSYWVLDKIIAEFTANGIMSKLFSIKNVYYQKHSSTDFKNVLDSYLSEAAKPKGAILFALIRGKISQGLDFSDEKCRAVVLVGVPYPAYKDIKVTSKIQYLNKLHENNKDCMNGNQWYLCETIRSINQSIGRVIRNKNDYGSIYLLDQRFSKSQIKNQISSWARGCMKEISDFQEFKFKIELFEKFFKKKNQELEQVQHFFVSHKGTKLGNKLDIQQSTKNQTLNKNKTPEFFLNPTSELQKLKVQLKQEIQSVKAQGKKKDSVKVQTLQKINKVDQKQQKFSQQRMLFSQKSATQGLEQCPVCQINKKMISNTECIHRLCSQCWQKCLQMDLRCPICRVRIRDKYLIL